MPSYRVRTKLGGVLIVEYPCPRCSATLKSPLEDARKPDSCPECGATITVPGGEEWDAESKRRASVEAERFVRERDAVAARALRAERVGAAEERAREVAGELMRFAPATTSLKGVSASMVIAGMVLLIYFFFIFETTTDRF